LDKPKLAAKLIALRIESFGEGMSDSEFGRRTGVSKGSIEPIMAGRQWVRIDTLEKWVHGCGQTLSEFFMDEKDHTRPSVVFDQKHRDYYRLLNHILQHGSEKQITSLRNQLETLAESVHSIPHKKQARR
jgi:transcriptional regulator with XRE-family HTH domain